MRPRRSHYIRKSAPREHRTAGMLEAQKTCRRLKAYRQLPILRKALEDHTRQAKPNGALETIVTAA